MTKFSWLLVSLSLAALSGSWLSQPGWCGDDSVGGKSTLIADSDKPMVTGSNDGPQELKQIKVDVSEPSTVTLHTGSEEFVIREAGEFGIKGKTDFVVKGQARFEIGPEQASGSLSVTGNGAHVEVDYGPDLRVSGADVAEWRDHISVIATKCKQAEGRDGAKVVASDCDSLTMRSATGTANNCKTVVVREESSATVSNCDSLTVRESTVECNNCAKLEVRGSSKVTAQNCKTLETRDNSEVTVRGVQSIEARGTSKVLYTGSPQIQLYGGTARRL